MKMLHPVSGEAVEVNPSDAEDFKTLTANGWKLADGETSPFDDSAKAVKATKAAKAE